MVENRDSMIVSRSSCLGVVHTGEKLHLPNLVSQQVKLGENVSSGSLPSRITLSRFATYVSIVSFKCCSNSLSTFSYVTSLGMLFASSISPVLVECTSAIAFAIKTPAGSALRSLNCCFHNFLMKVFRF